MPTVRARLKTLKETDFYPFRQIEQPVWGMTAHVIYTALDKEFPATISPTVIAYIRHEIGFNGFLICDDMAEMKALDSYGSKRVLVNKILSAGCDSVLHCSGVLSDMKKVISSVPELSSESKKRLKIAEKLL